MTSETDDLKTRLLTGFVLSDDGRGNTETLHPTVCAEALARIEALEAEVARLSEALTPSAETKVAYHGEFQFNVEYMDDEGGSYYQPHLVPWTTIKEIMAAIKARAALDNKQ